jgi:hypothetical protein
MKPRHLFRFWGSGKSHPADVATSTTDVAFASGRKSRASGNAVVACASRRAPTASRRTSGWRHLQTQEPAMVQEQLKHSGLADYFEAAISVEEIKRFKPHRSVYEHAANRLKVTAGELCLVAAHAWDVFGAINAGWMQPLSLDRERCSFRSRPNRRDSRQYEGAHERSPKVNVTGIHDPLSQHQRN